MPWYYRVLARSPVSSRRHAVIRDHQKNPPSRTDEAESAGIEPSLNNITSPRRPCRAYNRTGQWQFLPYLQTRRIFRSRHYSSCPLYTSCQKPNAYSVRFFPPKWFLAQAISTTFQSTWGGGWMLNQSIPNRNKKELLTEIGLPLFRL